MPELRLHIERLTLDGLPLSPAERAGMVAALEAELGAMIAREGLAASASFAAPALLAPQITAPNPFDPAAFGRALAGALYSGIGGAGR
jgi:hypothetical protein